MRNCLQGFFCFLCLSRKFLSVGMDYLHEQEQCNVVLNDYCENQEAITIVCVLWKQYSQDTLPRLFRNLLRELI